ncbi:VOC family protein [Spirosoma aerophilum]
MSAIERFSTYKKVVALILFIVPVLFCDTVFGQDIGVTRHNHLSIHVKDVPTSAAFYRDVIGLRSIPIPENLKAIRAWFDLENGRQIHLLDGQSEQHTRQKR